MGVTRAGETDKYKVCGGQSEVRGQVIYITEGFLFPPTPTSCSYLQIHIYGTNGHLDALSENGLLVLPQHLLSGQA